MEIECKPSPNLSHDILTFVLIAFTLFFILTFKSDDNILMLAFYILAIVGSSFFISLGLYSMYKSRSIKNKKFTIDSSGIIEYENERIIKSLTWDKIQYIGTFSSARGEFFGIRIKGISGAIRIPSVGTAIDDIDKLKEFFYEGVKYSEQYNFQIIDYANFLLEYNNRTKP